MCVYPPQNLLFEGRRKAFKYIIQIKYSKTILFLKGLEMECGN